MLQSYLEKIRQAPVYDVAIESPLELASGLSARLNNTILLKREDMQQVFSFKLRGAYNKMVSLTDAQRTQGVITASAGNHAQGVALSAQKLGVRAVIVMPKTTPEIKVSSVRDLGSEVVLHGNTNDDAYQQACQLADEQNLTFVHPYDDPDVIAGQGTVAIEILKQQGDKIDAIFVPVGGGGLIAGVIAVVKAQYPHIKVIGVEPEDAGCLHAAMQAGERVVLDQVGIFADGVAVKQIGEEPFRVIKDYVDDVILVSTDEICAAIKDIFDDTRSITEPAGALAVAGIKKYLNVNAQSGKTFVAIDSGANMNFDRLRHVAERAEFGEHREALLAVSIPEEPGSFRSFCEIVGMKGVTEFNYRFADTKQAHIFVGVQMSEGEAEKTQLVEHLSSKGYPVIDMTDNEMAKLHIRYMVGGKTGNANNERLFRFEFPERPGALLRFLNNMGQKWNISLFHYRNHGAAYGRVLVGMQVPELEYDQLNAFLQELAYRYWEETDNPAYGLFL